MPTYNFHCGTCGQEWKDSKSIETRYEVYCPNCMAYGGGGDGKGGAIRIFVRKMPGVQNDNLVPGGDAVSLPGFGRTATARTKAELRDLQKRAPENLFLRTDGEHTVKIPNFDERTGRFVMEDHTVKGEGIVIEEPHTIEPGEGSE